MTRSLWSSRAGRMCPSAATLLVALFLLSSLASTLPRCTAARPREARVLGLQSSSSEQYVHTSASTTDRSLPKISIVTTSTSSALRTYTLPKGEAMYHATQYAFDYLKEKQVWFAQDPAEGFPLVVYNQLEAIKDASYKKPPQTLPPADIYIRKCTAKNDLKLYLMAATEADSRKHLLGLYHPKTKQKLLDPAIMQKAWYGFTSKETQAFVDEFCAKMPALGYVGWRNPWDQDEIMLCDNINAHVECNGGKLCPASRWSSQIGNFDDAKPLSYFLYAHSERYEQPLATQRFHFFILPKGTAYQGLNLDQFDAVNAARTVMNAVCDDKTDLNSIVYAQAEWNKNNKWPWYHLKAAQTAKWFRIPGIPLPLPTPLPQPTPAKKAPVTIARQPLTPMQRLQAKKQGNVKKKL